MRHPYLGCEGIWEASGEYRDGHNQVMPLQGSSHISHQDGIWILDGMVKILLDPPIEFANTYRIVPCPPNAERTSWESKNSVLGTLRGRFAFVGDTILSSWESEDHCCSGIESLVYVDSSTYNNRGINRGIAFKGLEKLSSWIVVLKKRN